MSQSEGEREREREGEGERFRFTAENVVVLLTFLSSIKKNEHYKNQVFGRQTEKLREQFKNLKRNSHLLSDAYLTKSRAFTSMSTILFADSLDFISVLRH